MRGRERGAAMHTLKWYALFVTCWNLIHHTSVSAYAQSRGDQPQNLYDNLEIALRESGDFQEIRDDCAAVRHLGNWGYPGYFKKSTKNTIVNRSWDQRSESVNVRPKWLMSNQLITKETFLDLCPLT